MALIDVIKYNAPNDDEFVWKYPSESIKLGTQLVVNEGQEAIFVKGGQALDKFNPGTHTLISGNIPLLEKIVNLPFGGDTPFTAEIWFINTTVKRDLKWGTPSPIPLLDKTIGFPVNARAFGKWGARIKDVRSFTTQIVGSQSGATSEKVNDYFIGQIIQSFTGFLSKFIAGGQASILEVAALVSELSTAASIEISSEFKKFGVELINFDIESINIPDEDMDKIQNVFAKSMEARELSKVELGGAYGAIKSFEVLNNAAKNESDSGLGSLLGAGIGLGVGLPIGNQLGEQVNIKGEKEAKQPSNLASGDVTEKLKTLKELLEQGLITEEIFNSKRDELLKEL